MGFFGFNVVRVNNLLGCVFALCILGLFSIANAQEAAKEAGGNNKQNKEKKKEDYFAIINGEKISYTEYLYAFRKGVRNKFFHGKVSQKELDAFKKQVAEELVLDILLAKEAGNRGLHPENNEVEDKVQKLDEKFSNASNEEEKESWLEFREEALPVIKARVEREALLKLLKEDVKKIKPPSADKVKEYYNSNKEMFTAPQRWDVSIILLPVDPSSSSEVWGDTVEKAEKLLKKIRQGESFEEMARIHSGDKSAANGGDMGYMHIGMFGTPAQKVLNVMEPGELSEPVVLLEGVSIFRLNDVDRAKLNTLEKVEERARNLLMREMGEQAWKDFRSSIRTSADVEFGSLFTEEPVAATQKRQ